MTILAKSRSSSTVAECFWNKQYNSIASYEDGNKDIFSKKTEGNTRIEINIGSEYHKTSDAFYFYCVYAHKLITLLP